MIRVAILASGNGSNAQALMEHAQALSNLEVVCVISDKVEAKVLTRAKNFNIPAKAIIKNRSKREHEEAIASTLKELEVNWIFLAGYMRLFSDYFVGNFKNKIINIHPSLLPEYPGLEAYERAFADEKDFSGITIHYVDEGMDTGKPIIQEKFIKLKTDTIESFKARGLELEHKMYKKVLEKVANHEL
jgi:phosphoribosylglycinamide formyltransferase-1